MIVNFVHEFYAKCNRAVVILRCSQPLASYPVVEAVTFHYKSDKTGTPQFGLIAEDVAEIDPDMVVHDKDGEIYTVRYDAVNAMLLNEFLKEHRKVEEQRAPIGRLETTVAKQERGLQVVTAQLEQQTAQIQKVSAELEASRPALQVVNNP